jgi:DNA polymerase I
VNIQNIPRKDKVVKRAFLPKLDALLCFDYSQIEPRLLAYFLAVTLGDTKLADAIKAGEDPYTVIVEAFYGRSDLTDEERQTGKVQFLSMMYGGGVRTLIGQFNVDYPTAKNWYYQFHRAWPGVRMLHNTIIEQFNARGGYENGGYILSLAGRHLVPEYEHTAINTLIQGSAAEIMRQSLVKAHKLLEGQLMASHLVLTVHDELDFDAAKPEIPYLIETIPPLMTDYPDINAVVPLESECEISWTTWADKEPYTEEAYERAA